MALLLQISLGNQQEKFVVVYGKICRL